MEGCEVGMRIPGINIVFHTCTVFFSDGAACVTRHCFDLHFFITLSELSYYVSDATLHTVILSESVVEWIVYQHYIHTSNIKG